MGILRPARLSPTPAYGLTEASLAEAERGGISGAAIALLVLVVALAAATVWYVVLPSLHTTPKVERRCEVVVLPSGVTSCVRHPGRGSQAAARKASSTPTP